MKKNYLTLLGLIIIILLLYVIPDFLKINKDVISFIKNDETYPTAREAFKKDPDADIMRIDDRIYFRNDDWYIIIPKDPKDYNMGEVIGEINKKTTNEWWFRNMNASKLDVGTTVYSRKMYYRKGDAPFHIFIEEDGDVVFYQMLYGDDLKDDNSKEKKF